MLVILIVVVLLLVVGTPASFKLLGVKDIPPWAGSRRRYGS